MDTKKHDSLVRAVGCDQSIYSWRIRWRIVDLQELQQSSLKHLQCQKDYYFLTDSKTNSMMTSIRRNYFHSYLFCRYLISSWKKFVQLIYVNFFNKSGIRFLLSLHLMWVSSFLVWLCSRCQAQVFMKRFTTNT